MATFNASLAESGATGVAKLISEHPLPERDLGERRQQDDFGARILRPEDQHLGLKARMLRGGMLTTQTTSRPTSSASE
jgi:hypothetical protein